MLDFGLFIPTRGRVGLKQQLTLKDAMAFGTEMVTKVTYLVCPPDEVEAHRAYWPNVLGCKAEGIGHTRQWILDNSEHKFVLMFDDDHYFSVRHDPDTEETLERMGSGRFDDMVQQLLAWLEDGYPHVAVSARQGNNRVCNHYKDVARANNCHGYDRDLLAMERVKFGRIPLMEDFDVTLQLLELGYPNRVSYEYAWNQRGSGAAGGCSLYRTAELQAQAAHALLELHGPTAVKIVSKDATTESNWAGMKQRTDVNIQWRKAWRTRAAERKMAAYVTAEPDLNSYAVKEY